jgi:hypothetical protein
MDGTHKAALRFGRLTAFLVLGLLLPAVLLFQAHQAMGRMSDVSTDGNDIATVLQSLPPSVQQLRSQNDYALLSIAMVEASNQRTMLTKQRMKMSVMHIGFAVISLGLMMLVMGLEAGGIDVGGRLVTNAIGQPQDYVNCGDCDSSGRCHVGRRRLNAKSVHNCLSAIVRSAFK